MAKRKKVTKETNIFESDDFEAKRKALDATLTDITKRYGDGTIFNLGGDRMLQVDTIPSGSLGIDIALGVGGVPRGRITEIYGPESSGKTTLCLHVVAEAQKRGGLAAFIDMEHALDPIYAEKIGVDTERLYVSQPDTGEQALEITEHLVRSGALDIIVVDSVAALVPRAEIEGEMGDSHVGLQARLMSQALRKLAGAIKQSNVSVIFTNQLREKVGVMFGCFHYNSRVVLSDGTTEKIGKLVNQKRDVEVMSYDVNTQTFEPRKIVNWFNNGEAEEFMRFTVSSHNDIPHTFDCTSNHLLLTEDGYVPAEELKIGEMLVTAVPQPEMELAGGAGIMSPIPEYTPSPMEILDIEIVDNHENMNRFDIEVEGNHCYLVDGVVVHNSPETTPGGRALKFYASVRVDIRRVQQIKLATDIIGNRTRVKIKKNKVAAPFRECEFDIMFNEGISKTGEIIDIGTELNIVEKRGAFYRYNDELLGQGRENAKQFLRENPEMCDEIEDKIRVEFGLPSLADVADDEDTDE